MQLSNTPARPRATKVEIRRSRVRRDLAHHAITLMTENGFDSTTVEDIARAADYHPSSFFRYFTTKEDAVFIGIAEATAELRESCDAIDVGDDAWEKVRAAVVSAVTHFTEDDPDFFAAQFALWLKEPGLQSPLAGHFFAWEDLITHAFTVSEGRREPDLHALVVGGAIVSILRSCVRAHSLDDDTFAQRVERACLMLQAGLDRQPRARASPGPPPPPQALR